MDRPRINIIDHYAVLGIPSGWQAGTKLSENEITKAYRSKAREIHPDKKRDDPNAHANFIRLQTSYQVLKDSKTRKSFDDLVLLRVKQQREKLLLHRQRLQQQQLFARMRQQQQLFISQQQQLFIRQRQQLQQQQLFIRQRQQQQHLSRVTKMQEARSAAFSGQGMSGMQAMYPNNNVPPAFPMNIAPMTQEDIERQSRKLKEGFARMYPNYVPPAFPVNPTSMTQEDIERQSQQVNEGLARNMQAAMNAFYKASSSTATTPLKETDNAAKGGDCGLVEEVIDDNDRQVFDE